MRLDGIWQNSLASSAADTLYLIPYFELSSNPLLHGADMANISITCPNCAKILRCKEAPPAGKKVKCPSCSEVFLPDLNGEEDDTEGISEKPSVKALAADDDLVEEDEEEAPRRKHRRDDDDDNDDEAPRQKRRRDDDDDYDDDEDDAPRIRKKTRRKSKQKSGNSALLLILSIVGGVVVLIGCVVGSIGWAVWSAAKQVQIAAQKNFPPMNINFPPPKDLPKGKAKTQSFNLANIAEDQFQERQHTFQKDKRLIITVTSTNGGGFGDVDLYVYKGAIGENIIIADTSIGPNSRVDFIVPATDTYRLRVINLGPGNMTSAQVTIDEY